MVFDAGFYWAHNLPDAPKTLSRCDICQRLRHNFAVMRCHTTLSKVLRNLCHCGALGLLWAVRLQEGTNNLLGSVDYGSKWVEAKAPPPTMMARVVCKFLNLLFSDLAAPSDFPDCEDSRVAVSQEFHYPQLQFGISSSQSNRLRFIFWHTS
ncbi:hypothetical protein Tco_0211435 [Tanacetum coccineum]